MRRRCDSTFPSLHIIRCVTSAFDISSVKSATGTLWRTPRFAAMQRPSADFPIDGRAARMTRLPGWKPDVRRSSSLYPDGTPVTSAPISTSWEIRSKLSLSSASMCEKSLVTRCWPSSKTICSARSTRSVTSPGRSWPSRVISCPVRTSARSVAISLTIRA